MTITRSSVLIAFLLTSPLVQSSRAQHIHALMVSDTADRSLGPGCQRTIEDVQGAFRYLVPSDQYTLAVLGSQTQRFDANTILGAIGRVRVAKDDCFAFLYHGHGARAGGEHFLQMPTGGRLRSKDLRAAVDRKPCKLRLVITDSCNISVEPSPMAMGMEDWNVAQQGIAPVMEEMFLNHKGLLHVNASWPGQASFTSDEEGSWFFKELFDYCTNCPTGRPTWRAMDRRLSRELRKRFQDVFHGSYRNTGQHTLYPIVWSYPEYLWHDTPRFGVVADKDNTSWGVAVEKVSPGSPAENLTVWRDGILAPINALEVGDVILEIFGQAVEDEKAYIEYVSSSPRNMEFTFRRGGGVYEAKTALAW